MQHGPRMCWSPIESQNKLVLALLLNGKNNASVATKIVILINHISMPLFLKCIGKNFHCIWKTLHSRPNKVFKNP